MRIIKLGLISAVALFGIVWLISLQFPSRVIVSRAISIHRSPSVIRQELTRLPDWPEWNAFLENRGGSGWKETDSLLTGNGLEVELLPESTADTLLVNWREPGKPGMKSGWVVHAGSDSTQSVLQWFFDIRVHWYPWEKFGSIIFDKQLGPVMEKSLGNLQQRLEASK